MSFGLFLPFCPLPPTPPLTTWKIKILKKKIIRAIIILDMCIINENLMMYGSWDMEHNRQNFFSFWTVFCPLTIQKIKILKKWKKHMKITSFYHKWQSYDIWFLVHEAQQTEFFSTWTIFFPLTQIPQKSKFSENEKIAWR